MIPAIKLFKTPISRYFYDANKDEILSITEEEFSFLESNKDLSEALLAKSDRLLQLYHEGYLHPIQTVKIEHPLTPYVTEILDRCLQKVTLQLTQNCNFRCTYCTYTSSNGSQRFHSKRSMTFDVAKKAVDYLYAHSIDAPYMYIGFYGGEPLLEFELMKQVVAYANGLFSKKKLRYTITTNASVLNDEIIQFLKENNFSLVISLDGPERIHNKNRVFANSQKGTFKVVIEKLKRLHTLEPEFFKKIIINMVIDPSNDFNEVLSLFDEYPFLKECSSQINVIDDYFLDKKNVVSESYIESMEYQTFLGYLYLQRRIQEKNIPVSVVSKVSRLQDDLVQKFNGSHPIDVVSAPGGPCVPGKVRLLVTVDGKFIPCERVSETSEVMCLGDVEKGIDMKRAIQMLNIAQITSDACRKCWAFLHCGSCIKTADGGTCFSASERLKYCENTRRNVLYSLKELTMLRECQI